MVCAWMVLMKCGQQDVSYIPFCRLHLYHGVVADLGFRRGRYLQDGPGCSLELCGRPIGLIIPFGLTDPRVEYIAFRVWRQIQDLDPTSALRSQLSLVRNLIL